MTAVMYTKLKGTGPLSADMTDEFSGSWLKMLSLFPLQLHWNDVTVEPRFTQCSQTMCDDQRARARARLSVQT